MKLLLFWICLSVLTILSSIDAVSSDSEIYDKIPEFSIDFDTEQSKDRYDTRLLSKEIQKEESFDMNQEAEASCFTDDDTEYRHGQKILRSDPCETCLCMDGEIFCWWKKCGHKHLTNGKSVINKRQRKLFLRNKKQKIIKHKKRYKKLRKFPYFFHHHSTVKNFNQNKTEAHYPFESSARSEAETTKDNRSRSEIISSTILPSMFSEIVKSFVVTKQNRRGEKKISSEMKNLKRMNKDKELLSVQSNRNENEENNDNEHPKNNNRQRVPTMNDERSTDETSAKHYVITSSGNIENDENLQNENVLSKFHNPYSVNDDDIDFLNHNTKLNKIKSSKSEKFKSFSSTQSTHATFDQQQNRNEIKTTTDQTFDDNCIVMGNSYKIGTILPQETGNCLQCICIEGANKGEPPRVTCSPHNCPPLILPDLFDTTGY